MPPGIPQALSADDQIHLWIYRNRGVISRIARRRGVTRAWVSAVLYGKKGEKSDKLRIERDLAKAGAPFVADRLRNRKRAA